MEVTHFARILPQKLAELRGWTEKGSQCSATSRREVAGIEVNEKNQRTKSMEILMKIQKPASISRLGFQPFPGHATSLLSVAVSPNRMHRKSGREVLLDLGETKQITIDFTYQDPMIQISNIWKWARHGPRQAQQAVHQAEVAHLTTKYEKVKLVKPHLVLFFFSKTDGIKILWHFVKKKSWWQALLKSSFEQVHLQ